MGRIAEIYDEIIHTPLDKIWRHARTTIFAITAAWAVFWWVSGEKIEAYANDAVIKILEKNGMAPESFKTMQTDLSAVKKELENIGKDADSIRADLGAVKAQNQAQLQGQEQLELSQQTLKEQGDRQEALLRQLLQAVVSP